MSQTPPAIGTKGANIIISSGNVNAPPLKSLEEQGYVYYQLEFSKPLVEKQVIAFKAGKLTQLYIETYLQFAHLEGVITNLEYLNFRELIKEM